MYQTVHIDVEHVSVALHLHKRAERRCALPAGTPHVSRLPSVDVRPADWAIPLLPEEHRAVLERAKWLYLRGVPTEDWGHLMERPADVMCWRRAGLAGVEVECAATFAVARHFGAAAAGAFVLVDNLADGHAFYDIDDDQAERIRAAGDAVIRSSVAAVLRHLA